MSKRDRQICALIFALVWIPLMAGVWWVGTIMTQALVGMVVAAAGEAPGPIINDIPSSDQSLVFCGIAFAGLVLGCLGCRYWPEPITVPPPPPVYELPASR